MLATIIKRESLAEIEGKQTCVHYRAYNEFWKQRMRQKRHKTIIFLSGRKAKAFLIEKIEVIRTPVNLRDRFNTEKCFAIHINGRFTWPRQLEIFNMEGK